MLVVGADVLPHDCPPCFMLHLSNTFVKVYTPDDTETPRRLQQTLKLFARMFFDLFMVTFTAFFLKGEFINIFLFKLREIFVSLRQITLRQKCV